MARRVSEGFANGWLCLSAAGRADSLGMGNPTRARHPQGTSRGNVRAGTHANQWPICAIHEFECNVAKVQSLLQV
jgi:hypothetical protein